MSALPIGLSPAGHFSLLNPALQSQDNAPARGDMAAGLSVTLRGEHGEERPAPGAAWPLWLPNKCRALRGFPFLTSEKIQISAAKLQAKYYLGSDLCLAGVLTASSKQVFFIYF